MCSPTVNHNNSFPPPCANADNLQTLPNRMTSTDQTIWHLPQDLDLIDKVSISVPRIVIR